GPMGTKTCHPKRPVSVIHLHGTADEFAPFKGGRGPKSLAGINFYSVEYSIDAWVQADGCPAQPNIEHLHSKTDDGTSVTKKVYGPGKEGTEVVLITIDGAGHTWPGQEPRLRFLGKSTKNIDANAVIWKFFQKHPME